MRLIKIIEEWGNENRFCEQVQDFINSEDIDVLDIKYSVTSSDNYDQTGHSAMIIYKKTIENAKD